jgi:hypothetical protein
MPGGGSVGRPRRRVVTKWSRSHRYVRLSVAGGAAVGKPPLGRERVPVGPDVRLEVHAPAATGTVAPQRPPLNLRLRLARVRHRVTQPIEIVRDDFMRASRRRRGGGRAPAGTRSAPSTRRGTPPGSTATGGSLLASTTSAIRSWASRSTPGRRSRRLRRSPGTRMRGLPRRCTPGSSTTAARRRRRSCSRRDSASDAAVQARGKLEPLERQPH